MARRTGTKTNKQTTKQVGRSPGRRRPTIAGLPIEGSDPATAIETLAENYIDTQGEELPEPIEGLSIAEQAKLDQAYVDRKRKTAPAPREYAGPPIPASQVFTRQLEAVRNTRADMFLILNRSAGTYTVANTYRGGVLPPSYNASHYTYTITPAAERRIAAKTAAMSEVEPHAWPAWTTVAAVPVVAEPTMPAKRGRRRK